MKIAVGAQQPRPPGGGEGVIMSGPLKGDGAPISKSTVWTSRNAKNRLQPRWSEIAYNISMGKRKALEWTKRKENSSGLTKVSELLV